MAQLILTSVGQALGARVFPTALRALGAQLGRALGSAIGGSIDNAIFGATRRVEGPRLTDLHIQGSTEGASIPTVYGRVRIAGQVIWAARFKEHVSVQTSGGKGGPRVKAKNYSYTLSFAVGLCEGEVARIGRVWANGEPLDMSGVAWRLHSGGEAQAPDPLIEAVEGENAPAYRGLAYVVFEDLPLERFGNVLPQLSFEVVRQAPSEDARLETMARGVCLIPGSGEFVYATTPVRRLIRPGVETPENVHQEVERANLEVALDQLKADLPACESVLLVVSWFGTDLRCGACEIKPGVEIADKSTAPITWHVNGVARADAHVVSQYDGGPAFGGTPADETVIAAIQSLKARGYKVGLYPFILMDVPGGNALPDPYGAGEQAAYPWRGRITLHPAPGQAGTPDKTGAATAQIAAFFGAAAPSDFATSPTGVSYSGPTEWSFRRFILHYAKLAAAAGGVDAFILGSELRGLTRARSSASTYPAVGALRTLAADVRGVVGGVTKLTYAADWSEYFGHQPADGSGDVHFHLDPLWADSNIDAVGIDWWAPLTDWRDGASHADAQLAASIHDADYLDGRIEAGENFDWYYASKADRDAQTRTVIADGAYGKPWVFRPKDLRAWWSNAHFNRPGGVESPSPTAWTPESKPIWFAELGCPAIDKGANAPNLFLDPKSAESGAPPYSSGARDDLIQRRVLEAYLRHWNGDPMLDPEGVFLWCWDARPHPAFPARVDVWSDAPSWRLGHWLSGRAGLSELGHVAADLCLRAGVSDVDVSDLSGAVAGYVVDAPSSARAALEPLMLAYDFIAVERGGEIIFTHRAAAPSLTVNEADFVAPGASAPYRMRGDAAETPIEARVLYLDAEHDYRVGAVSARRRDAAQGGVATLEAALALDAQQAEVLAKRALAHARAGVDTAEIIVPHNLAALEVGDVIALGDASYEVLRIEDAEARKLSLRRALDAIEAPLHTGSAAPPPIPASPPSPDLIALDLPPLPGAEADRRPLAAVFAEPWSGPHQIYAGAAPEAARVRGEAAQPALIGELLWALWPGPVGRWDDGNTVRVRLSGEVSSVSKAALLNGANLFAVESGDGWEVLQARNITLVGVDEYEVSGFLRGLADTGDRIGAPIPVGARIVKLDERLTRLDMFDHEFGEPLTLVAPPFGAAVSDARATTITRAFAPLAARLFAPVHIRARRDAAGDIALSWVRAAPAGGDSWGAGEPPLGAAAERYRLEVMNGASVARTVEVSTPAYLYTAAAQTTDFGAPQSSLTIRVGQLNDAGLTGRLAARSFTF